MTTYARAADTWRCDECGREMHTPLFCDGCGADYPERRGFSPFAVLGLPVSFDLDEGTLDRLEVELTRRLHPDAWASRGDRAQRKAMLAQAAVNDALAAVRDPFERAETLLGLFGGARQALPQAFLLEQLDLQERIEQGIAEDERRPLRRQIKAELAALQARLRDAFARAPAPDALAEARDAADRSRYWRNAERALRGNVGG